MNVYLLTKNSTPLFKYIVWALGYIMEGIFNFLDMITNGKPNVGLAIILFTIVVNLLMLPLTVKMQKFSKLSAKISPEINAIRDKYKDRKDQDSQFAMNNEISAVYARYGVSPTGSCGYLLIQMPILFALYRVINSMPAYVAKIKGAFYPLVLSIISSKDSAAIIDMIKGFKNSAIYAKQFESASFVPGDAANSTFVENTLIDCLNNASTADFNQISATFSEIAPDVAATVENLGVYNSFLGLNIGNSPWYIIKESYANQNWGILLIALSIPVLSAVTQWLNVKLMPQQNTDNKKMDETAAQMQSTMKTMNMIMPLMSAYFCFSFPTGMGIYWVASSVVRGIMQVLINKHIDKMDFDKIIKKNAAKSAKKMEKMKANQEKFQAYASMNTKNIQSAPNKSNKSDISSKANISSGKTVDTKASAAKNAKSGSMFDKANMVNNYNNKSNK